MIEPSASALPSPVLPAGRHDRWRVFGCIGLCCLPVFIAFFSLVGYRAYLSHRFNAARDAVSAAGYATSLDELVARYPEVPDDGNGALMYQLAFEEATDRSYSAFSKLVQRIYLPEAEGLARLKPFDTGILVAMEDCLGENENALALVQQAAEMPQARFPLQLEKGWYAKVPWLDGMTHLAHLQMIQTYSHIAQGDKSAALSDLEILFAMADALRAEPVVVSQLTVIAMEDRSVTACERVVSLLPLDDSELVKISELIGTVSESERFTEAFNTHLIVSDIALRRTYTRMLGSISLMVDFLSDDSKASRRFLFDDMLPMLNASTLPPNQLFAEVVLFEKKYTALKPNLGKSLIKGSTIGAHAMKKAGRLELVGPLRYQVRMSALVRVAQTAIAVERYRLKHGDPPTQLDAVVPEFLDDLPADPHHGEALVYELQADGFTVYALGANGVDDGGNMHNGDDLKGPFADIPFSVTFETGSE
jgi:hypothetical protein